MEDAKSAFRHFDSDDNGDVSKREMRSAVQRIYRERKSLTASLADMSSAISKLDGVLLGVGVIIFVFAAMLIFNRSSTVASLVPLSTIVYVPSVVEGSNVDASLTLSSLHPSRLAASDSRSSSPTVPKLSSRVSSLSLLLSEPSLSSCSYFDFSSVWLT